MLSTRRTLRILHGLKTEQDSSSSTDTLIFCYVVGGNVSAVRVLSLSTQDPHCKLHLILRVSVFKFVLS